jgi:hypothetical protein
MVTTMSASKRIALGLGIACAVILVMVLALILHSLADARHKPTLTIANESQLAMRRVHVALSGPDLGTREFYFDHIDGGCHVLITVDTAQECVLSEAVFLVGDQQYTVTGGPAMGPGEHGAIVCGPDMMVGWRYQDGVTEPLNQVAARGHNVDVPAKE